MSTAVYIVFCGALFSVLYFSSRTLALALLLFCHSDQAYSTALEIHTTALQNVMSFFYKTSMHH